MVEPIELSTGHVFAPLVVRAVGPIYVHHDRQNNHRMDRCFDVFGLGFKVTLTVHWHDHNGEVSNLDWNDPEEDRAYDRCLAARDAAVAALRQEVIDKLLPHG